ncbi:MAG: LuxR C-terminal-related transcriptional regulator [Gammaproteobacteria bacterium]|nr:LuxR C-terminal-related transcriptional regulator [Gammaproteobacteria bacterium]
MHPILETSLTDSNIGFCIKNKKKKVVYQNDICTSICGALKNKTCVIGCMELYEKDQSQQWKENGSCVYKNTYVHKQFFDITVLVSDDQLITFLQPLKVNHQQAMAFYEDKGLSEKELNVITHVIQNHSNESICKLLCISKPTLKTHLNNIYRKVREHGEEPKYIPHIRR